MYTLTPVLLVNVPQKVSRVNKPEQHVEGLIRQLISGLYSIYGAGGRCAAAEASSVLLSKHKLAVLFIHDWTPVRSSHKIQVQCQVKAALRLQDSVVECALFSACQNEFPIIFSGRALPTSRSQSACGSRLARSYCSCSTFLYRVCLFTAVQKRVVITQSGRTTLDLKFAWATQHLYHD